MGLPFFGGDQSGNDRKIKGYNFAIQHIAEITKELETKRYILFLTVRAAPRSRHGKGTYRESYKVGESVMLSADEGDEFTVRKLSLLSDNCRIY